MSVFQRAHHPIHEEASEHFRRAVGREDIVREVVSDSGPYRQGYILGVQGAETQAKPRWGNALNRYEQILEAHARATGGLSSAMAGASRLARLTVPTSCPRQEALRDVAAVVVAPTLVGFVLWVLQRSQQLGLKSLYFLSRDGQVLLEIARRLANRLNIRCELCYLYGSRQACNLPAVTSASEEQLSWMWDRPDFLSIRSLLSRVSIDPEEVRESLSSIGFTEKDWGRNLDRSELLALRAVLRNGYVRKLILEKATSQRHVLIKYLRQEGLLASTSWGFVDAGWRGSIQDSLATVLSLVGGTPPVGLYFGLLGGSRDHRFGIKEAYFGDRRLKLGFVEDVPNLQPLIEMFCAADHGTVISFVDEGGRVRPVLKEEHNQAVTDWGLPVVRETIYCFAENLPLDPSVVNPQASARVAAELLKAFWLNPRLAEVIAWAEFPWEDGLGKETCRKRLAEGYRIKHLAKLLLMDAFPRHHRNSWIEGSIALSPPLVRWLLRCAHWLLRVERLMVSKMRRGASVMPRLQ